MAGNDPRLARIRWACRRGMLELDVLLQPFFDNCFGELDEAGQEAFERLLSCDDPRLFTWLMGGAQCEDAELAGMITNIVDYNRSMQR